MNYTEILNNEYNKALKDVADARFHSNFRFGIRAFMDSRGWTIESYGDNSISFYGASRLFRFYAHHYSSEKDWTLSERIRIVYENYSWTEPFLGSTKTTNTTEVKVSEFRLVYNFAWEKMSETTDDEPKLKEYRTEREKENDYDYYVVSETYYGYGAPQPIWREFDNLEDAKKFAYDYAEKQIKEGKERNDCTSRHYLSRPTDFSEEQPSKIYAWKYYEFSDNPYYVYISGYNK